jgi:hypothetical protein
MMAKFEIRSSESETRSTGFGHPAKRHSGRRFRELTFRASRLWQIFPALGTAVLLAASIPESASSQVAVSWPAGSPVAIVQGPTLNATLRNACQATSDQVRVVMRAASDAGRRSKGAWYQAVDYANDFSALQVHFQNLRATFNVAGNLALQLQSIRAANASAELSAGLNIIAEAFTPAQQELQSGTLERETMTSLCQVLGLALAEWQKELKKDTARLGMIR